MRQDQRLAAVTVVVAVIAVGFTSIDVAPVRGQVLDWDWSEDCPQYGTNYGWAVSTAGDVNGDGFSDLVTGAPYFDDGQTDNGRVTLHYGSVGGLDWAVAPLHLSIGWPGLSFGYSVAVAGDVNNDGYDDVVVGAPDYDDYGTPTDAGRVYLYLGSAGGLANTPAWTTSGTVAYEHIGMSVATAGDVNGDGRDDIVVASPSSANHRVQLFLGASGGLQAAPVWETNLHGGTFLVAAAAGDVNGDGRGDIVIGTPNQPVSEGAAHLYLGTATGVLGAAAWTVTGGGDGQDFGFTVGMAGDVDGDGYGDVVVGDHGARHDIGGVIEHVGRAVLYRGHSGGLSVAPAWETFGHAAGCTYGYSVVTAGDINGDGFADVIVGDRFHGVFPSTDRGYAAVFLGSRNGLPPAPSMEREGPSTNLEYGTRVGTAGDVNGDGFSDLFVSCLGGAGLVTVTHGHGAITSGFPAWDDRGDGAGAQFGAAVAAAGDVDGNGFGEIVVGSPGYNTGTGRVTVFAGPNQIPFATWTKTGTTGSRFGSAVACAGDVNGDGYSDLLIGAPEAASVGRVDLFRGSATGLGTVADWTASGAVAGEQFGGAVASAGDVNGDGYADVIVGAPSYGNGENNEGRCLLYLGSATGLGGSPVWVWESNHGYSQTGFAVAGAGDVNRDGYDDVLIGAPGDDTGAVNRGRALLFLGSPSGLDAAPAWSVYGLSAMDGFGHAAGRAGDVNNDGYADVIVGAPNRSAGASYGGQASVFLGSAAGLSAAADWVVTGTEAYQYLGRSVAGVGDVDLSGNGDVLVGAPGTNEAYLYGDILWTAGTTPDLVLFAQQIGAVDYGAAVAAAGDIDNDGFADVLVGAPATDDGYTDGGAAYLHLGNGKEANSDTWTDDLAQTRVNGSIIDVGAMTTPSNTFVLHALGRCASGRADVRLEYRLAPITSLTETVVTTNWIDTGSPVIGEGSTVDLTTIPAALTGAVPYRWRARIAADSPFFPRTPWFALPRTQASLASLRAYVAPPLPDLVVESLSPLSASSGRNVTVSIVVRNQSSAAAVASQTSLSVDGNVVCGAIPTDALAAGARDTVSCQIGRLPAGGHVLFARVDAASAVVEANEANNTWTASFTSYDVLLLTVAPDGSGARPTIQAAVDDISTGGVIELAPGTFTGTGNREVLVDAKVFTIRADGDAVIDCQGSASSQCRALEIRNAGVQVTLEGLTIRNGWRGYGAGVNVNTSAQATIRHCAFANNHATSSSGALHLTSGAFALVEDCVFDGNVADDSGGTSAVGSLGSVFRRCEFTGGYGHWAGGAFYFNNGAAGFEDCVFWDNASNAWGGAIHVNNTASAPTFTGCTFHANSAPQGGVIYARNNATASFTRCILSGSAQGAASYCASGGSVSIACSDVFGNAGGDYTGCLSGQNGVNGNISADPLFCDAAGRHLGLQIGSPCAEGATGCGQMGAFAVGCGLEYVVQPDGGGDFATVQAAVDAVLPGDTILLAPGVYTGPGNRDVLIDGKAITIRGQVVGRDVGVIIDCQGSVGTPHRAFQIQNVAGGFVLEQVTITGGYGTYGGAVLLGSCNATIRGCTFVANDAVNSAGVHIPGGATVVIEDCAFLDNHVSDAGGACAIGSTGSVLRRCVFTGNTGYWAAGGLYFNNGAATVDSCVFAGNTSEHWGGAIHVNNAASGPVFRNTTFHGNAAPQGGVIYGRNNADATFERCILAGSTAGAASYCATGAAVVLTCSDVYGNAGGDYTGCLTGQSGVGGNIGLDPHFCDAAAGDFQLADTSPCLPEHNDCAQLIGALGAGCGGTVAVDDQPMPAAFALRPNLPNPFNPRTTLGFDLPQPAAVCLVIYDVAGREVRRLLAGDALPGGTHELIWDGRDDAGRAVPSGTYFARFTAASHVQTCKMALLR